MWIGLFAVSFVGLLVCIAALGVVETRTAQTLFVIGVVLSGLIMAVSIERNYRAAQFNKAQLIEQLSDVDNLGVVDIRELQREGVYTDPTGRIYMWQEGTLLVGDKKTQ